MAKGPTSKSGGPSRIRLVVMEAEIAEGSDITQFTQAMQNALRGPTPATIKRITASASPLNGVASGPTEAEDIQDDTEDAEGTVEAAPQPTRPRADRKPAPTPEVLPIDFNAYSPTLNAFAAEHKADSHRQRYLLVSAWFHEHGDVTKVTPAHIYTAYRWMKWPLTLEDFAQPLRDLKKEKLFGSTEKGTYTINHIGLQRVADMKTNAGG